VLLFNVMLLQPWVCTCQGAAGTYALNRSRR
jgi:hypothetical protein